MKKIIIFLILIGILSPNFIFIQTQEINSSEKIIENIPKVPGTLEKVWQEEIWPILKKMWDKFYTLIGARIVNWFKEKVQPRIKQEVETKKPIIKEEFQKEKKEVKEEAPGLLKSLWARFKELVR